MSPSLLALLGQQGAARVAADFLEDPDAPVPDVGDFTEELERLRAAERARLEQEDNPVVVVNGRQGGSMQQAPQLDEGPMNMGNRDWIEERDQALKNQPQRKGMFGIKGTLRDVLGMVGDAFLVNSGAAASYAPHRQKEREQDAMVGFTQSGDPEAAINRMTGANPDLANAMNIAYQNDQSRQDNLASQKANRESQIEDRRLKNLEDVTTSIQRLFGSEEAQRDPAMAITIAQQASKRNGISLEELLGVPLDQLTPEMMKLISRSDSTVNQTEGRVISQQRADATTSQAVSSRIRAEKPPAPRAPPKPLSVQEQVDTKVMNGQPLTKGEQKIYDRKDKSGRGGRTPPANVAPPERRFERVKTPN